MAQKGLTNPVDGLLRIDGGEHPRVVEDGEGGHARARYPPPMPNRRPRLELHAPGVSEAEAAAIVAAVERFLRDRAPAPLAAEPEDPWRRTALLEGVVRGPLSPSAWGDPVLWA